MNKNITAYILTRLFRGAPEDDIIYSVCEKTGLNWEDAQDLVERVRNEHSQDIEARHIPLKSALSALFYILGIILIVGPIVYLWVMLDVTRTFLGFVSNPSGLTAETALQLFERRCALLGWFELPSIVFTMLAGAGIIHANLRYMSGIWETLFRKWKVID